VGVSEAAAARARATALTQSGYTRYPLGVAVLAAAYYGAAQLGYALQVAGPVAAVMWLPVGVGIAFLYHGGVRFWPGVLVGDLLANDYQALPLGTALGQTCGNVLEMLVATILLRRLVRDGSPLASIRGLMAMLAAIAAGVTVSATVGSLAQVLGGFVDLGETPTVWRTWWLGDAAGALVVVPLALTWYPLPPPGWLKGRAPEAAMLLVTLVGVSEVASFTNRPYMYLVFPVLMWAALRFDQRVATLAVTVAVGVMVFNASERVGAFAFRSISDLVVDAQLFISVAALTTLCLTAVMAERNAVSERLQASRARLVEAAETERRRLVRNLHDGAQQRLTALVVYLRIASEQPEASGSSPALLKFVSKELLLAIEEVRELAHGLHPVLLVELGLGSAIRGLAARATVPVTLVELPRTRLDDNAEVTAYYVVAEALANAQKHARAASVKVRVGLRHHHTLCVEVVDDGAGGAVEAPGSGLQGLRDRVEAVGGSFTLDSDSGGTSIVARIPASETT
jgi:signal transduction histidine kinase